MKVTFNDSQTLQAQSVSEGGGKLIVSCINNVYEQLIHLFTNKITTKKMTVEDGNSVRVYENYTEFGCLQERPGKVFSVEMYRAGQTPEERLDGMDGRVTSVEETLDIIVKGEVYNGNNNGTGEAV